MLQISVSIDLLVLFDTIETTMGKPKLHMTCVLHDFGDVFVDV